MKTREEERKEDMEVGEIIIAFPITLVAICIVGMLYPVFGAFYALGAGIAVFIAGLWSSHINGSRRR